MGPDMKWFLGRSPGSSKWRLAVPAGVAAALLAAGLGFAAYFATEATDGASVAQETQESTPTASAADSSAAPAATPQPSPETVADSSPVPTATPQPTPTLPPCLPCEARPRDQLRVNTADIQLGPDGKYYVPDRGDGCAYQEIAWSPMRDKRWVSLYDPGCGALWLYLPATGEVQGLPVCPCYDVVARDQLEVMPEDIRLASDGKYYVPDRGDGCTYREEGRAMVPGGKGVDVEAVFLWAAGCELGWTYEPGTGRVNPTIP